MAYISINDFKFGMDRRRKRVAGTPGTLWTLENAHLTRGADIERAKKFVPVYTLPAGTRGLFALNRQLYCFGSADLAASMPVGMAYQRLQSPDSGTLTDVVDVTGFSGKVYAIADYTDGGRFHFYDASRVTDWDVVGEASATYETLAQFLAEKISADSAVTAEAAKGVIYLKAKTPGTAFTLAVAENDGGGTDDQTITAATPQANVAAVAEVVATATITIDAGADGAVTEVVLGAQSLIGSPVVWNGTNEATAIRLAQAIIARATVTGYAAAAVGNVVTISAAAGTGATPNGTPLAVSTSGNISVSADLALAGGVTAVAAVAQVSTVTFGGTFEAEDDFTVTVNGTAYKATGLASGTGRSVNVFYRRVWSPAGPLWRYSMLTRGDIWDPANVEPDNDAGFLNVALDVEGNQNLIAAERYQKQVAVYSEEAVVLYNLDTDPANFAQDIALDNTSTYAAGSLIRYGNNDVFHLDLTGVRSLRALNSSNAPFVSDVGNAIDSCLLEYLGTLTEKQRRNAVAAIEPTDGRYLLAVGNRIFVLSFFPGAKISAWSYYSPGFEVEAWAKIGKRLYCRSGDTVYLYGGESGAEYPDDDELDVVVELPFLSAGSPATKKGLYGFDIALTNEWEVFALVDPNREDKVITIGKFHNTTYAHPEAAMPGEAPIVALRFVCTKGGPATISMAQIHFDKEKESG